MKGFDEKFPSPYDVIFQNVQPLPVGRRLTAEEEEKQASPEETRRAEQWWLWQMGLGSRPRA